MRRNAGTDAAASNLFTDGDPGAGTPASVMNSDWANIVQEEIAEVIEGAGLTLDQATAFPSNDTTQLLTAIQILAGAAGGGGAGAQWQPAPGDAPLETEEHGSKVFLFESGQTSKCSLFLKVPEGYTAGRQITCKIGHYSPASADTQLLKAVTTLIRKNQDAIDSTTNQHTSTNTALTNTVAKQLRLTTLDLTDADGEVNSVAVAAGDLLKVDLYRDTDTDSEDIRFIASITEPKF